MALSANTALSYRNNRGIKLGSDTVKTGTTVYKNALIQLRAAGTACEPCTNNTTAKFLGVAKAYAQATETVSYYYDYEAKIPVKTAQITAGNRLADVYAYDDSKVTTHTTLGPKVGVLVEFLTSYAWVWIRGASFGAAS